MRSFDELDAKIERAVCLGNFDGIHLGHQKILGECLKVAAKHQLRPLFFSFEPHPRKFFTGFRQPQLLLTPEEKIELVSLFGFDEILLQDFSDSFSKLRAAEFIERVLIRSLHTKFLIVGREFRFGFQAEGSLSDLKTSKQFEVLEQAEVIQNQQKISSSWIRRLVELGEMEEVRKALGYDYFLTGRVVSGEGRGGAQLGVKTINLESQKECLPPRAVYVSIYKDMRTGLQFPSVTNIGVSPSFGGQEFRIESHLLSTEDDFYGREGRVFLLKKLRDEIRFNSVDELKSQIQKDIQAASRHLQSLQVLRSEDLSTQWSLAAAPAATQSYQGIHFTK